LRFVQRRGRISIESETVVTPMMAHGSAENRRQAPAVRQTMGGGQVAMMRPPNPPLQRTRGAGFARTGSPLNGKPLGDRRHWVAQRNASRRISRVGWLLSAGTILTAVSMVPIFVEQPAFEWLGWFGVAGTLVAALVARLVSSSAFFVASVVGFFANIVFLAVLFGLVIHFFEQRKAHSVAQSWFAVV
jgi:hypothetical protein